MPKDIHNTYLIVHKGAGKAMCRLASVYACQRQPTYRRTDWD